MQVWIRSSGRMPILWKWTGKVIKVFRGTVHRRTLETKNKSCCWFWVKKQRQKTTFREDEYNRRRTIGMKHGNSCYIGTVRFIDKRRHIITREGRKSGALEWASRLRMVCIFCKDRKINIHLKAWLSRDLVTEEYTAHKNGTIEKFREKWGSLYADFVQKGGPGDRLPPRHRQIVIS